MTWVHAIIMRKNRKAVRKLGEKNASCVLHGVMQRLCIAGKKTTTTTDRCMCEDQKQNKEAKKEKASLSIWDNTEQL